MTWQPHTVTSTEVLEHAPCRALSALFDDGAPPVEPGSVLPPLWHWVALPTWSPSSLLDPDGHPRRGSFLPPVVLPRRMFAGGEVVLHAPLRVGASVTREATVTSVTPKQGRSGRMVVVVVQTRLHDGDRLALEERQDIVFRESSAASPGERSAKPAADLAPVGPPLTRAGEWRWDFATDPSLLMRFSAATSNAHRIHYDWPYATAVEGYPGLVVHGPLMTLALAETARLEAPGQRVRRLGHRNVRPLFCGQPAQARRTAGTDDAADITLGLFGGDRPPTTDDSPNTTLSVDYETAEEEGPRHA
jgi:3-methylfumaryl-CoA hydratase